MAEKINIPCSKCGGTGCVQLPPRMLHVLKMVGEGHDTAPKLHAFEDDVTITAINNRLEDLRNLGLLARRKSGKTWIYSLVERKES